MGAGARLDLPKRSIDGGMGQSTGCFWATLCLHCTYSLCTFCLLSAYTLPATTHRCHGPLCKPAMPNYVAGTATKLAYRAQECLLFNQPRNTCKVNDFQYLSTCLSLKLVDNFVCGSSTLSLPGHEQKASTGELGNSTSRGFCNR